MSFKNPPDRTTDTLHKLETLVHERLNKLSEGEFELVRLFESFRIADEISNDHPELANEFLNTALNTYRAYVRTDTINAILKTNLDLSKDSTTNEELALAGRSTLSTYEESGKTLSRLFNTISQLTREASKKDTSK